MATMCGITGIISEKNKDHLALVKTALNELKRRGPDEDGTASFPICTLGHTRLSIIDLAQGKQPMIDHGDSDIGITFNGEIYNYKELRQQLEQKGHSFKTTSDTEVILKAYKEFGVECVKYLDGMFAFAIWDEKNKRLFLARDRFGEKPLYYSHLDNTFYFASEIKALIKIGIEPIIDLISLDNYLALLYVPPWRTIYKNIKPLKPAHYLLFEEGQIVEKQYWQLTKISSKSPDFKDAVETVRDMVSNSVKSRMIADVEVGTFLSGGIDSAIITRLASNISPHIKSFSIGFDNIINELPYAKEISTLSNTDHHENNMGSGFLESFKKTSLYFDSPFADSSNIPTAYLSEFASKKVKVALSGDGGDELFWGYGHSYTRHFHLPFLQKIINKLFSNPYISYINHIQHFKFKDRKELWKDRSHIEKDIFKHVDTSVATNHLEKINLVDIYMALPGDILTKVDQSSMMHSLEVRSPFLNHRLAEFAFNLPQEFKANKFKTKIVLKDAFKDLLPEDFLNRKKQGFGAPIGNWLMEASFKDYVEKSLLKNKSHLSQYLNNNAIEKIIKKFYAGDRKLQYKVWSLICLEEWFKNHPYSN